MTITQSVAILDNDEEVISDSAISLDSIKKNDLTNEKLALYISAKIEEFLYDDMTADDVITLIEGAYRDASNLFKLDIKAPNIKRQNVLKRLKRCATCNQLFYDLTARNQSTCCNRNFSYDSQGRLLMRNGKLLSECHREKLNGTRRTKDERSVSDSRIITMPVESLKVDDEGNVMKTGKRRHSYGYKGAAIRLPHYSAIAGVFDEYFNIKDQAAFDALDDDIKKAVMPSECITY